MTIRICVDLDIWISQFLADARGLRETASQAIVQAIQEGRSAAGPVQLVISYAMLSRLEDVLVRKGAGRDGSARLIELITTFARLGPASNFPTMVLGGGVEPTADARVAPYDPYDPAFAPKPFDPEDGRVLDAALAGRADALVTANLRDFVGSADREIVRCRVYVRSTASHTLCILRPAEMAVWLRTGDAPFAPGEREPNVRSGRGPRKRDD